MIKYLPIQSGSGGNCAVLFNERVAIILDAGVKPDEVERVMRKNYKSLKDFECSVVLVTHAHGDHCRYMHDWIRWGVNVRMDYKKYRDWEIDIAGYKETPGGSYVIESKKTGEVIFNIDVFPVKHDVPNMGYVFTEVRTGRKVVWFTDASEAPQLKESMKNADIYLIELNNSLFAKPIVKMSNHDSVKYINAKGRHLSEIKCVNFLNAAIGDKTRYVHFLHLSTRIDQLALCKSVCKHFVDYPINFSYIESTNYPNNDEVYIELDPNPAQDELVKLEKI